jgi:hypothetical protein
MSQDTGTRPLDGTGLFSDAANTVQGAESGNIASTAMAGASTALDTLGMAMDPLGSLASAGIGWLIEHVKFLHEGLDKLAGAPQQIQHMSTEWKKIAEDLDSSAGEYSSKAKAAGGTWTSSAGQAYQQTAANYTGLLHGTAASATDASGAMTVAGVMVGTERGIIRDLISTFVGELIRDAVIALASSEVTLGGSVAAFITDAVYRASRLASKIGTRVAKLLEDLGKLASKLGRSGSKLGEAAAKASRSLEHGSTHFQSATPTPPAAHMHTKAAVGNYENMMAHGEMTPAPSHIELRMKGLTEQEALNVKNLAKGAESGEVPHGSLGDTAEVGNAANIATNKQVVQDGEQGDQSAPQGGEPEHTDRPPEE